MSLSKRILFLMIPLTTKLVRGFANRRSTILSRSSSRSRRAALSELAQPRPQCCERLQHAWRQS